MREGGKDMATSGSEDAGSVATRLRAARESAKVTQAEAAVAIGVSRPTFIALEKGKREPSPNELVTLGRLYRKPISELLRPTSPPVSIRAKFRTALARDSNDPRLDSAIETLQQIADDYLDLIRRSSSRLPGRPPSSRSYDYVAPERAGEDLAHEERNRLGLGDGPIQDLREILEIEVGLRIFLLNLPSKIAGLFIHIEQLGGCVGVNSNHPSERRRWTLAHEYAHFLTSRERSEVTLLVNSSTDSERLAEAFAENFLMPRSGISRRFGELKAANDATVTPTTLVHMAHTYRVSVQAMCLRLENLSLIRRGTWDRLRDNNFQSRRAAEILELPVQSDIEHPYPYHYRTIAARLYADGDITETQFARFLGLSIVEARQEFDNLTRSSDVGADGLVEIIDLIGDSGKNS